MLPTAATVTAPRVRNECCILSDDIVDQINAAVADETVRLIAEGVPSERPDWLAVIVRRRLYIACGRSAAQQLSHELKEMGEL